MRVEVDASGLKLAQLSEALCGERLWTEAARQWHALYYDYIPYRTGTLADAVRFEPGRIVHTAPYARQVYYGSGASAGGVHPLGCGRWDQAALGRVPELIDRLQRMLSAEN